ncbi:hypothetical protein HQ576_05255, partial [bacterium]|nr:hypothetical protein [bacterium]
LFLTVGSVHRYAKVWVNSQYLGEHIGYLSSFEFEITKLAPPGQPATVALCVDSRQRWDVDCLTGAYDIIDEMFIPWGGITGHVGIEGRGEAWFQDVFIQPRLAPQPARLTARLVGTPPPGATVRINVRGSSDGGLSVTRPLEAVSTKGGRIELDLPGKTHPNAYWSPERPTLLTARLSLLRGDEVLDTVTTRFGQRVIEIRGPHLYLNGKRLFLRGYGDDCVFPETVAPPADKAVYLKRFRLAKDYGFNYVRHHSHFMPPEYYEAADEIGMFVSPELPIAYLQYYNRAKGPALELFKTEWAAAIRRFRNHPSIFDWCMGNEMWNGVPIASDLYRIAKELDPTRPIIDSDGLVGGGWLDGKRDRPTLDFLMYMFDLSHLPLGRPDRHRFAKPTKPVLSHEMGNYITFPRLDAIERFQHNFKPFWLTPVKAKLEKLGLLAEADTWARNSERLYLLCHKLNIEDLRKNPFASGYHWWLLQDYWTGSNGIVDHYFRPKPEITPALVRRFNAPVVLLLDGLDVTYRGGSDAVVARLLVSNFADRALRDATLTWQARLGDRVVAQQTLEHVAVGQGELGHVGDVRLELPATSSPMPLIIEATLASGKGPASVRNDWTAWVYPASAPPKLTVPLYAGPELVHALAPAGAKAMPAGPLPAQAVYVMGQPTLAALDAAAAGACLILLSPHSVFPTAPNRFKTAWWLGNARDNNVGTVVYPNPITDAIAP